ncbi:zinc finger BED domain-containing protein RICESLEEPER 2-like [Lactuca sativa]|uniref:zinc finger BED domain-containing protein RICESLEEPER 2-like n=1 Tax=Lactuca sativa TaxID=4236 RepID=UPI0022B01574|nr:zinc finger BED domain-containing protein RICESLEEPER 2-like [Lactuca sativa]
MQIGGQTQLAFQYGDENKLPTWKFDQNESQKALAHMLVVDELPFSFVEGAGFRYYNSVTQPLFKVPCRKSHRGVDIGKMVEKCLTEWEIENVFTISVDNAMVQDGIKKVDKAVEIVRWAVKWIRQPPSRIHKFTEFAKVANPGITKHLKRDVPTRWNSTYHMLEIAQAYQKTFERYDLDEFDFWCEIEKAGLSIPSSSDWERARNIYISFVRSWMMLFPSSLCDIALARNMKFDKYFGDIEKMNLLLYFALILDPRNKVKYLVILLEDRYGEKGVEAKKKYIMDSMYELYNDYIKIHSPSSTSSTAESTTSSLIIGKRQNPDFMAPNLPLRNKLREKMKTNIVESIGELEKYLQESVEDDLEMFSILDWWKVNSSRFMVLSLMARDVFVIPVSTVASESVFSTSGRVLDPFRSSLTPKIVESLICTQDWIQGSISDTIDYEKDWEENQQIDKELSKMK